MGMMWSFAATADEFTLMKQEHIGRLRIGGAAEKVKTYLSDCQPHYGPKELWATDGAYHQLWKYADCGIVLSMVSETARGSQSIEAITLNPPSTLTTQRGIRIGSPRQAVINAYRAEWNQQETPSADQGVAGSLYGGLVFDFKKGKVTRIFLGAAAE